MKLAQAEGFSAYPSKTKRKLGQQSELLRFPKEPLDKFAIPLLRRKIPSPSASSSSSARSQSQSPPPNSSMTSESQRRSEEAAALNRAVPLENPQIHQHPDGHFLHADDGDQSRFRPVKGSEGKEKEKLEKRDSLRVIDPAPKRVSEVNLKMDMGDTWDIGPEKRLSKSLRGGEREASDTFAKTQRAPRSQIQRLNSLGKMVSTKLSKMSPRKSSEPSASPKSSGSSTKELDEALMKKTAEGLESDPNVSVPRRPSTQCSNSPTNSSLSDMRKLGRSLSEYRNLFVRSEDSSYGSSTWEQVDMSSNSSNADISKTSRRRKSTLPGGCSPTSRTTPLEKKLGYAGMAPLLGNALAGSFYRKTRSKSFTNRREKGFMGYSQSRSTTFMKEFEMDAGPAPRHSLLRSKSLSLRKRSAENAESMGRVPESVEERRSDFERKALEYNFNYSIENLRHDRESYLAYRAKLNRTSSFRNEREGRAARYNHLRSHSFTNGLPEISEDELTAPHPNKDNTTNDNIKRRTQRNPVAA